MFLKILKQIPDKDNTGNIIPAWKRQMLAKKAAERARKELEEQMHKEAEAKRLQSIPQWKRQLIAKKEETESKIRSTIYTPKVVDDPKATLIMKVQHDAHECLRQHQLMLETAVEGRKSSGTGGEDINNNNNYSSDDGVVSPPPPPVINSPDLNNDTDPEPEDDANIIPWRAQLRKTNSKLNLLD